MHKNEPHQAGLLETGGQQQGQIEAVTKTLGETFGRGADFLTGIFEAGRGDNIAESNSPTAL